MKQSSLFFGRNVLREALSARATILEVYVETQSAYEFVSNLPEIKKLNVKIEEGIPRALKSEVHQGVAFKTNHDFYLDYDAQLLSKHSFIVACNHVEDVHNLGSIARCAAAFGASLIIHEDTQSASVTTAVVKSSAGCAFKLNFMKVADLASIVKAARKRDFSIYGLDAKKNSTSLYEWKPKFPLMLILGSEKSGIDSELVGACDELIKISMKNSVESLNVSHAAGLAMSWAAHQAKTNSASR